MFWRESGFGNDPCADRRPCKAGYRKVPAGLASREFGRNPGAKQSHMALGKRV